jgi:hypothetical protein
VHHAAHALGLPDDPVDGGAVRRREGGTRLEEARAHEHARERRPQVVAHDRDELVAEARLVLEGLLHPDPLRLVAGEQDRAGGRAVRMAERNR